jgi:hypothetical protein
MKGNQNSVSIEILSSLEKEIKILLDYGDITKVPMGTILANVTYQGHKPKETHLITVLEDQISAFRGDDFIRNKDILIDFFFDMYDIDINKLTQRDGIKEVMRDIKLINVLN